MDRERVHLGKEALSSSSSEWGSPRVRRFSFLAFQTPAGASPASRRRRRAGSGLVRRRQRRPRPRDRRCAASKHGEAQHLGVATIAPDTEQKCGCGVSWGGRKGGYDSDNHAVENYGGYQHSQRLPSSARMRPRANCRIRRAFQVPIRPSIVPSACFKWQIDMKLTRPSPPIVSRNRPLLLLSSTQGLCRKSRNE